MTTMTTARHQHGSSWYKRLLQRNVIPLDGGYKGRKLGFYEAYLLCFVFTYIFICFLLWNSMTAVGPLPKDDWDQHHQHLKTSKSTTTTTTTITSSSLASPQMPSPLILLTDKNTVTYNHNINQMLYVGKFGLGHRLSKMVSAYHLAASDELCPLLDEFVVDWGDCTTKAGGNTKNTPEKEKEEDVFAYLFGSKTLPVPCRHQQPRNTQLQQQQAATAAAAATTIIPRKTMIVRNDVRGYFAGQSYKNAKIPLSLAELRSPNHPWNVKMDFDQAFFRELLDAFRRRHGKPVEAFQRQHNWKNHYVVGLHLRAGNGEQDHFVQADRGIGNVTDWCHAVVQTLRCMLRENHDQINKNNNNHVVSSGNKSSPILVFLSTDTTDLIPVVEAAMGDIPVRVFPQERLPSQEGVSYQKWTEGELCFAGWKSAMTDMALLAQSDLLVAATRSTFTQILPLSQVLSTHNTTDGRYKFCEAGNYGRTMTCFQDRQAWFLRQSVSSKGTIGEMTWRQQTRDSPGGGGGDCGSAIMPPPLRGAHIVEQEDPEDQLRIVHKVLVHLPDVDKDPLLQDAVNFLQDVHSNETRYYHGAAFSRKYRGGENSVFRPYWTID